MSSRDDRDHDIGQEIAEREARAAFMAKHAVFAQRPLLSTDDPVELLRRLVMDSHTCHARETCDCSEAQSWRWLRDRGVDV